VDIVAQFKIASVSLALLCRDYDTADEQCVVGTGGQLFRNVVRVEMELANNVRSYLQHKLTTNHEEDATSSALLARVLVCFSTLSSLNERLQFKANMANGGMGRANEYLRIMMLAFEQLRAVKKYDVAPVKLAKGFS